MILLGTLICFNFVIKILGSMQEVVFTNDGPRVVKGAYDFVRIKNRSREWSHKRNGIGVGRIRPFQFYSDSAYDYLLFTI